MIECNRYGKGVRSDLDRLPMLGGTISFRNHWLYLFDLMCKSYLQLVFYHNADQRSYLRLRHLKGRQMSC